MFYYIMNKSENEIFIKYFKFLEKDKKTFKNNENIIKFINKGEIYNLSTNYVDANIFLEIFFFILDKSSDSNSIKYKFEFLKINYKVIRIILDKKIEFIYNYNENITLHMNEFIKNVCINFSNDDDFHNTHEEKNLKYILIFLYYFLHQNNIFFNLDIEIIIQFLKFLFECKYDKNKITEDLIFKIIDNFECVINNKICEIFNTEDNIIMKYLNNFKENFYYGLYDLEMLTVKNISQNLINSVASNNKIPDIKSSIINLNDNQKLNFQSEEGRFGICGLCKIKADFYCIKTRLPICSFDCKDKLIFKENFMNFLSNYKNYNNTNKNTKDKNSLIFLKLKIEDITQHFIKKLINSKNSNHNEENKSKLIFKILIKIFTKLNIIIDNQTIIKIKSNLAKIIFKYIHMNNIDKNELFSTNLELILILIRNYGNILKSEILLIIEELINIISDNLDKENKIKQILIFFKNLFSLHKKKMIFFIFNNFDNKIQEKDIIKEFIEVLFKLIYTGGNQNKIKIRSIKLLSLVTDIIHINFKYISNTHENNYEKNSLNEIQKIKQNYSTCKEHFNKNYKDILNIINERKINTNPNEPIEKTIAEFLRFTHGLEKEKIGLFLGNKNELNQTVYEYYLNTFNFKNLNLSEAMRQFLFCFKICGESQIIDRIITKFSLKYFEDNKDTNIRKFIDHSDSVYYLSFNIMILHTNLHNPNVNQKDKLNFEIFCKTLINLNNGNNFDTNFLRIIYDDIKTSQFMISENINKNDKKLNLDCFMIKLDLMSNFNNNWILDEIIFNSSASLLLKIIFQNLIINLESILSNIILDKKLIYSFYDFFIYFIEILENCKLIQEKISLINIWIKLIDFRDITLINANLFRSIKIIVNFIYDKHYLFKNCWANILNFIVDKYLYLEKIKLNKNPSIILDEFTQLALDRLLLLFSKINIENCFLLSLKFDQNNFVEFINSLFEILLKDLEYNNRNQLNKFILEQMGNLIKNYSNVSYNKIRIWIILFMRTKKLMNYLINSCNTNENLKMIFDFILILFNSFILEKEDVFLESFNFVAIIIEKVFYLNFGFYEKLVKIIIFDVFNSNFINSEKINLFSIHLNSLINKNLINFETGEEILINILKIIKIIPNFNSHSYNYFYNKMFTNLLEIQSHNKFTLLDNFLIDLIENLNSKIDFNLINLLINISDNYFQNLNKNFDVFTKLITYINNFKNDENLFAIILFNIKTNLKILEDDLKYFKENNISFNNKDNINVLLIDIKNHSFYVKIINHIHLNKINKSFEYYDNKNLEEILLNLENEIKINFEYFIEPIGVNLDFRLINYLEGDIKKHILENIEILFINLTNLINFSISLKSYNNNCSEINFDLEYKCFITILEVLLKLEENSIKLNLLIKENINLFENLIKILKENVSESSFIIFNNKEMINLMIKSLLLEDKQFRKSVINLLLIINK